MFLDGPNGLTDPSLVQARKELLATQAEGLTRWHETTQALRPELPLPEFDPAEAGARARALLVLQAPGKSADPTEGSGFVSVDNEDRTSTNLWNLREHVGFHDHVLITHIMPWYLGEGVKPSRLDLQHGGRALINLLPVLRDLHVIILIGGEAQKTWDSYVAPAVRTRALVLRCPLPTARALNKPDDASAMTLTRARDLVQ
ncbi:hypothetical protein C8046_05590 [Serinibacter arcticus]|uniref:Uracil-DNA glycosylase-like domain-containing protein n=1 Tax=Serinibacter arcticus TaxID=1655435 RepID=A0A2U1ZTA9_9MICO|nr:uracil-DNA glycosylase family protein [Serinibacter arcticus]PWD50216.1 hypothetical protein C8046_05590 [Serinibacter arcticus]